VAALEYSSQASRPCPPANTTDPRVPSVDVAGLFPTGGVIIILPIMVLTAYFGSA
jgi:hypothetical protein